MVCMYRYYQVELFLKKEYRLFENYIKVIGRLVVVEARPRQYDVLAVRTTVRPGTTW